ncbi:MAG TPA: hypothetical protein VF050_06655 [Moraxellaceae bacterium]
MKKWMLLLLPLLLLPVEEVQANKAAKARAAFDRMDREDFLDGIEEAGRCTQAANYPCADSILARIKELISDEDQQQLWQQTSNDVRNARQRAASLLAAQEEERRAEEREIQRRNDEAKQKMIMSMVGMATIAAHGRELGADNAGRMMDAWNADVQRGDGSYSNTNALADTMRAENQRQNEEARRRLVAQREKERQQEDERLAASRARAQQIQQQQQQQLAVSSQAVVPGATRTTTSPAQAAMTAGKSAAAAEQARQQALREQRIAEQERAAKEEARRVMQPFVESSRVQQQQQQRPAAAAQERTPAVEVATSRTKAEPEKKRDFGPAKAWCIANEKGTGFQCKGPLQNMWGFEKSLEVALDQVDCPNGTGYTPKPGQGGSSFDCGRRLNVTEQQMPLYDPFRGGGKPVVVRWEDCDPKAPNMSVRCY